jgi:hypothetical protein
MKFPAELRRASAPTLPQSWSQEPNQIPLPPGRTDPQAIRPRRDFFDAHPASDTACIVASQRLLIACAGNEVFGRSRADRIVTDK